LKKIVLSILVATSAIFAADSYVEKDTYGAITDEICQKNLAMQNIDKVAAEKLIKEHKAVLIKAGTKVDRVGTNFNFYTVKIKLPNGDVLWVYEHNTGDVIKSLK